MHLPIWGYLEAYQVNDLMWLDVLEKINNSECWFYICLHMEPGNTFTLRRYNNHSVMTDFSICFSTFNLLVSGGHFKTYLCPSSPLATVTSLSSYPLAICLWAGNVTSLCFVIEKRLEVPPSDLYFQA